MKRLKALQETLGDEDQRTYRRWTRGLYASYLAIVLGVIALTYWADTPNSPTHLTSLKASRSNSEFRSATTLDLETSGRRR